MPSLDDIFIETTSFHAGCSTKKQFSRISGQESKECRASYEVECSETELPTTSKF